jgi:RNA polymerase sigma factor (sigma-70 family)
MRAFLAAHATLILRLARSVVRPNGEPIEAEDVAQEVVATLLRLHAGGTFDPARVENPEAYLRVVVRRAARRAAGRRALVERVGEGDDVAGIAREAGALDAEPAPSPEEIAKRSHDARRMLAAIKATLRPRDAVAFALLIEDGLDIHEVATRLGTTANNVYQMRHRILTAARELLGKLDDARPLDTERDVP